MLYSPFVGLVDGSRRARLPGSSFYALMMYDLVEPPNPGL